MRIQPVLSLLILLLVAFPPTAVAEKSGKPAVAPNPEVTRVRADDQAIAADALASYISRKHDPSATQVRKDAMHTVVAERAQKNPAQTTSATFVFRTGLTVPELAALAKEYGLEVMAIDVKTPFNDIGVIQTIHIGAVDILKWDGDFEAKAKKAIGSYRYKYMQRADKLESLYGEVTEDSKAYRGMASSAMLIYRSEVFGEARNIKDALVHRNIALIVPDSQETVTGKVESYKSRKDQTEERRATRRKRIDPTG